MLRAIGAYKEVFARAYENKAAREARQALPHKIKLYGTGGGSRCVRIAAMLEVLAGFELINIFSEIDAISGAGGPAVGYATGYADKTLALFIELVKRGVIYREPFGWKQISIKVVPKINIELYEKILSANIDNERLVAYPGEIHVIAARRDGSRVRLNLKDDNSAAKYIAASSALPYACDGVDVANYGKLYDGLCAGRVIPHEDNDGGADNILVLQSHSHINSLFDTYGWPLLIDNAFKTWPDEFKNNLRNLDDEFKKTDGYLQRLSEGGTINYARIAPSEKALNIGPLETDHELLEKVADETRCAMRDLLVACKSARWI